MRTRVAKFAVVLGVGVMLVAVPFTQLFSAAAPEEEVDRLIIGFAPPPAETNLKWTATWLNHLQYEPMLETLIGNDPETGDFIPGLATEWEANEDFTTWTFQLREGVQFHFGYGELTAEDVKHSYELVARDDSRVNMAPVWQDGVEEAEIIDDYTIAFHFDEPYVDGERLFSRTGGELYITSKAQWDEGGEDAMEERLVGTGVYQFKERNVGENLVMEAFEGHWSHDAPFPELEMKWVPDETTRLSQLIAGEIHAAELGRDVAASAVGQGMEVIASQNENMQRYVPFGGLYFNEGEPETDPNNPLLDRKVRKALIRAVDLEELQEELYHGRVTHTPLPGWHPLNEGWSDWYEERWEDLYSYDPDRARELLEESDWDPNDIEIRINHFEHPGQPESPYVLEALQPYWEEIGIEAPVHPIEHGSFLTRWFDEVDVHGEVYITRNTPIRSTQEYIEFWHAADATGRHYLSDYLEERRRDLAREFDEEARDEIAREIGEYLIEQAFIISLGATHVEITVNPDVVEDWAWPGMAPTNFTHYYEIVPAATE